MKAFKGGFVVFIVFFVLQGCFVQQELPVEYDYSYRGKFDKYDTFDFVQREKEFLERNPALKNEITSIIESHMNFLGYKKNDRKPDLLLSFNVFQDSLNLRGYDQMDIEQWMRTKDQNLDYERLNIAIKRGTLFIQFFDRRQNASIWQGYATDEYQTIDLTDSRDVRNAVKSILNKYQFFSQEFIKEQKEMARQRRRNS